MNVLQATQDVLRAMQNKVDWSTRDAVAGALAEISDTLHGFTRLPEPDESQLRQLRVSGICEAPISVSPDHCREVVDYFEATKCYMAHVPAYSDGVPRSVAEASKSSNYGSYQLRESLLAPHLVEFALAPPVIRLAAAYLGCIPSLYSINTFWTFPSVKRGLSHEFHRDEDDYRFMVIFIYWTDVAVGEGEFYFIEATHDVAAVSGRLRPAWWAKRIALSRRGLSVRTADELRRLNGGNGYGYDSFYNRLFSGQIRCVTGRAGTAIGADTFALHRGSLPQSRPRLVTWIRYGLYENEAYRIDKTRPVPAPSVLSRVGDDPTTRYITRLVLDWER